MSQRFKDLKVQIDEDLEEKLSYLVPNYSEYRVLRQSVDARRSRSPHFIYTVEVAENGETLPREELPVEPISYQGDPILIVGSGPAGLFAALRLVERGIPCHLFERGSACEKRMRGIVRFWRYGELDPDNNVCFGEGGAGLYSDGKLITRIKSPYIPYVLDRLVQFGAPEEIRYLANPHVGSDKIRRLIPQIRYFLKSQGCKIHFDTKVTEILCNNNSVSGLKTHRGETFHSPHVILATGHSAGEVFEHLQKQGVALEGKSYALGLRIEHPQSEINRIQFRELADHPKLGAANYRLTSHDHQTGVGVYSFCMCPGGYVLSSGTEDSGIVTNGMSNYRRNSPFANAAIVVTVDHEKNFGSDIFGGLKFRKDLEERAKESILAVGGTKELPAQRTLDFLSERESSLGPTSSPSKALPVRLDQILPREIFKSLKLGLEDFEKKMGGFLSPGSQLFGIESRTSCPIRILRDPDSLQSTSHHGLYPTGEGAGYAGGITSAACDGVRVAEAIVETISSRSTTSVQKN